MLGQGVAAREGKQGEEHGGYKEEQGGGGGESGMGVEKMRRMLPGERHLSRYPLLFPHPQDSENIFIYISIKTFAKPRVVVSYIQRPPCNLD